MTKSIKKEKKNVVDVNNPVQVKNAMTQALSPELPDGVEIVDTIRSTDGRQLTIVVEGLTPDSVMSRQTTDYVIRERNELGYAQTGLDPTNGYYWCGTTPDGKHNLYRRHFIFTQSPF